MRPDPILPSPGKLGVANGTAFHVYGKGQPLVLIHGVGMSQAVWAPQMAAFADRYQVVVYDMLGHGDSRLPAEQASLGDYAAQLLDLLDVLDIPAAHVVGHSMGALVALEFALNHPERTRSVTALNAVYCRSPEQSAAVMQRAETLADIGNDVTVEATLERWFDAPTPPHLLSTAMLVRGLLKSVDPVGYARTYRLFASSDRAHVDRLPTLTVPALFMTGELDPNSSPAMSQAMAAATPQARLEILPGERHMMSLTAPEIVNQRLRAFLEAAVPVDDNPN